VIIPINQRVEELVDTFESNSEIDLDDKQLKDTDIELICKKLIINKQCRKLRLEQNDISAKGVTILSDTLYGNTTLVELYLSNNRISDMGVHALSQALSINNSKLEWLELHSNNITDEGVEYLVEMLKTNKKINLLGLSFNRISDRGVRLLSVAITCYNDTLQSLQLASNKLITDASVDDLKEMITQNQSLQALWINDCSLSTEGKNKLRQAASLNTNFILEV
jgi:Ran GTPase-activating protein (RanGAP) involved in mRNA processing and transport